MDKATAFPFGVSDFFIKRSCSGTDVISEIGIRRSQKNGTTAILLFKGALDASSRTTKH